MPKRKVTFQGVGDEDDEDEISVPKKKVRWPDPSVLWRTEGKEGGEIWREERWGDKERVRFSPCTGFGRIPVWVQILE